MHSNQTQSTPVKSENSEANPHPISNESPAEKMERKEGGHVSSKDLREGDVFGRWTLVSKVLRLNNQGHNRLWWNCRCACGVERCVIGHTIASGKSVSCGCYKNEVTAALLTTHGATVGGRTPEYGTWKEIRKRVFNERSAAYENYGGRGITMCRGWKESFPEFLKDVGVKPSASHSIDRIDNEGSYSCGHCEECLANGWPMNCRWATRKEQNNNTRQNVLIEFNGKTQTLKQWAEEIGVNYGTLYTRVMIYKWPPEKSITATLY